MPADYIHYYDYLPVDPSLVPDYAGSQPQSDGSYYGSYVYSYSSQLPLSIIKVWGDSFYEFAGWKSNDVIVGFDDDITIDGNNVYVSICLDSEAPRLSDTWPYSGEIVVDDIGPNSFTLTSYIEEMESGLVKAEYYYRKCGSDVPHKLTEVNLDEPYIGSDYHFEAEINECLPYGDYYVYAVLTDAQGNERTTKSTKFTLAVPPASMVGVDSQEIGTGCNTLECSLNELFEYFTAHN